VVDKRPFDWKIPEKESDLKMISGDFGDIVSEDF
jgi:hypothetical protein